MHTSLPKQDPWAGHHVLIALRRCPGNKPGTPCEAANHNRWLTSVKLVPVLGHKLCLWSSLCDWAQACTENPSCDCNRCTGRHFSNVGKTSVCWWPVRLIGEAAQALSNTVWAFSKLEVLDEELFGAIAREATQKLPGFNAQNIANTVGILLMKALCHCQRQRAIPRCVHTKYLLTTSGDAGMGFCKHPLRAW